MDFNWQRAGNHAARIVGVDPGGGLALRGYVVDHAGLVELAVVLRADGVHAVEHLARCRQEGMRLVKAGFIAGRLTSWLLSYLYKWKIMAQRERVRIEQDDVHAGTIVQMDAQSPSQAGVLPPSCAALQPNCWGREERKAVPSLCKVERTLQGCHAQTGQ